MNRDLSPLRGLRKSSSYRWFRFAPPPATFCRASGACGLTVSRWEAFVDKQKFG
jgi:hypothetical protein